MFCLKRRGKEQPDVYMLRHIFDSLQRNFFRMFAESSFFRQMQISQNDAPTKPIEFHEILSVFPTSGCLFYSDISLIQVHNQSLKIRNFRNENMSEESIVHQVCLGCMQSLEADQRSMIQLEIKLCRVSSRIAAN